MALSTFISARNGISIRLPTREGRRHVINDPYNLPVLAPIDPETYRMISEPTTIKSNPQLPDHNYISKQNDADMLSQIAEFGHEPQTVSPMDIDAHCTHYEPARTSFDAMPNGTNFSSPSSSPYSGEHASICQPVNLDFYQSPSPPHLGSVNSHAGNPLRCEECKISFTETKNLKRHHIEAHNPQVFLICAHCVKRAAPGAPIHLYGRDSNITLHYRRVHKGVNLPECAYDHFGNRGKVFSLRTGSNQTIPTCSKGHLNYVCPRCGKAFKHRDDLNQHWAKSDCKVPSRP